jgi:hypothetical protein
MTIIPRNRTPGIAGPRALPKLERSLPYRRAGGDSKLAAATEGHFQFRGLP